MNDIPMTLGKSQKGGEPLDGERNAFMEYALLLFRPEIWISNYRPPSDIYHMTE